MTGNAALAGARVRGHRRHARRCVQRRHVLTGRRLPMRQIALPPAFEHDALVAVDGAKQRQEAIGGPPGDAHQGPAATRARSQRFR